MTNFTNVFQSYVSDDGRRWVAADSSDSYPHLMRMVRERSEQLLRYERIVNLEIGETIVTFHEGRSVDAGGSLRL